MKQLGWGGYGWLPDKPDFRDLVLENLAPYRSSVPNQVDLRTGGNLPPVYDQGQLGSCTANALAAAFDFDRKAQGKPFLTPSRLFIYWEERNMEDTVQSDAGAAIRDGIKVLKNIGVPPETDWPYDIAKFTDIPTPAVVTEAQANESLVYKRVPRSRDAQLAVLASGKPFVFGFTVYESFESAATARSGVVPMPHRGEQVLGGHAVVAVGYDLVKEEFIVRNSWGDSWGDGGYFYMPFNYLTHRGLSSDFWVIETVKA